MSDHYDRYNDMEKLLGTNLAEVGTDCISRQAAIDAFNTNLNELVVGGEENAKTVFNYLNRVLDKIKCLPSAQPKPKRGKWIPVDSYSAFGGDEATWMAHGNPVAFYYCSECKKQAYAGEDGESLLTDYCPNCGAKMKGVSNES